MIDTATFYDIKSVHSTLSNLFSRMASLPFQATEKKGSNWDIAQYQLENETIIFKIESFNLILYLLVSIYHDRLPSQSEAISNIIPNLNNLKNVQIMMTM